MIHIAYHESYRHELPDNHKFPMKKYSELAKRLVEQNIYTPSNFFVPNIMEEEILYLTHDTEYIERAKTLRLEKAEARRLGFPQSNELYERELRIAYGTLHGAELALQDGLSFNIAGGTHHAFTNKGEGFCMFNDIAVSANYLINKGLIRKALVIDLDVHQGNGTAEIFTNNPSVFTFSVHGKNNYPVKKEISDLDIELDDLTGDEEYLNIVAENVPKLIAVEKPDIVYYIAGADILETDKFGRLSVSIAGAKRRDEIVFGECKRHELPVMCVMGGGYSKDLEVILETHLNTFKVGKEYYS
ncbi:MAG: histone deacetylase [Ignavibacteriae bacterium HGW-Ignavibacteriae-4]|jgi:acetoin utilization deacetylase AcuC-like enzyme|nr:MAG: histone deacetylase [Ignavibacteriae bacterium HGW-Ignavibacteriae-4]